MPVRPPLDSISSNRATDGKQIDPHGYAAKEIRRREILNSPKRGKGGHTSTPHKADPAPVATSAPTTTPSAFLPQKVDYVTPDGGVPPPPRTSSMPPPPPRYEPVKRLHYALPSDVHARPSTPMSTAKAVLPAGASGVARGPSGEAEDEERAPSEATSATGDSDEGAPPAGAESETVTLDRSDFRQLVIALRNLREQRTADLRTMGEYRDALVSTCQLASQEAPGSHALAQMIERLRVDGLLPPVARVEQ